MSSISSLPINEVIQKVEASLQPKIDNHLKEKNQLAGLDFLDTKNSLLLSLLIELTHHHCLRLKRHVGPENEAAMHRLTMIRTALDKVLRGLDKKLRYQIDMLLVCDSATYASVSQDDPMMYRPNALASYERKIKGIESGSSSDEEMGESEESNQRRGKSSFDDNDDDNIDDDLAAARETIAQAKKLKSKQQQNSMNENQDDEDGIYRAPRQTAVPYAHDKQDLHGQAMQRQQRRIRTSEVAETLREQYGHAPEQQQQHQLLSDDRQHRRLAEREAARTAMEEDNMIRFTVSRADKKERKRMLRQEQSNLAALSDLGSLAAGVGWSSSRGGSNGREEFTDTVKQGRHINGKRQRKITDREGRTGRDRKSKALNALQQSLYGGVSSTTNKKSKSAR